MKTLITFLLLTCSVFAVDEAELDKLPQTRMALFEKNDKLLSSPVTLDMIEGFKNIADGLLPIAVKLEAALEKKKLEDVRKLIERDLEAVIRAEHISQHSQGWGGAEAKVYVAVSAVVHLEERISYTVFLLKHEDKDFDFQAWLKKWSPEEEDE